MSTTKKAAAKVVSSTKTRSDGTRTSSLTFVVKQQKEQKKFDSYKKVAATAR